MKEAVRLSITSTYPGMSSAIIDLPIHTHAVLSQCYYRIAPLRHCVLRARPHLA